MYMDIFVLLLACMYEAFLKDLECMVGSLSLIVRDHLELSICLPYNTSLYCYSPKSEPLQIPMVPHLEGQSCFWN